VQGKNSEFGLEEPEQGVLETHPTVNSDLYLALRHGDVKPKGDIKRFDGQTVHFKDGSSEEFDTVIACTGYKIEHKFFDKSVFDFSSGVPRLYRRMIPDTYKNIYFMGLFQPLGCIWPGAELQSKLAARHFAGLWRPQKSITQLIDDEHSNPDFHQVDSPRHTITEHDTNFRKRLHKDIAQSEPFLA